MGRQDYETETLITYALRADGFDASEDGTGRSTPLEPVIRKRVGVSRCLDCKIDIDCYYIPGTEMLEPFVCTNCGDSPCFTTYDIAHGDTVPIGFWGNQGGQDAIENGFPALRSNSLGGGNCPAVAFRAAGQDGFTPDSISPPVASTDGGGAGIPTVMTLAIRGRDGESSLEINEDGQANTVLTPNGGRAGIGVGAVAFDLRNGTEGEQAQTLQAAGLGSERGGNPSAMAATLSGMQVRRLTPIETARLQGVPDEHCRIPYKGRVMADGPIYKMHGNGFCVNVVKWIGERLNGVQP